MPEKSIIVIGGGIVGLSCAVRLQQPGATVSLLDPDSPNPAPSLGNAGHIAVEQVEPLASRRTLLDAPRRLYAMGGALDLPVRDVSAWAPFAMRFVAASAPAVFDAGKAILETWLSEAMPAWRRLAGEIGADDLLAADGHYVVWENARSAVRGAAAWGRYDAASAASRPANERELNGIAQLVGVPIAGAIRFTQSGQMRDLSAMREALIRAFEAGGGRRIAQSAQRLEVKGGRGVIRLDDGAQLDADVILVAAGVGSGALLSAAGHKVPIIAERGYHIESASDTWPADLPPVVFEDRSLIVTRFAKTLRAASFVEFSRADAPPDPGKWRRLRRHAAELRLPLKEPIREWIGSRPTLPDYLPAIGKSERADNVFYAFGHQHLGLTLAPITAEMIAQIIGGHEPKLDARPFDLRRFDHG